ncbi:MAG TPA: nucleotidyltransferase family protein [Paludibacter sp.]|nr:nucleotidyltransferase family protein [Paludibacter sp.]
MKALIFAAGLGTRLKPITDSIPKALVPIGGKTLLEHVILKLKAAGFNELIVNIHHFPDQIIDFLREKENFGIRIEVSDERDMLLDTGGGIKKAACFFDDNKPFLVHNMDIISNIDLNALYAQHLRANGLATLVVSRRDTFRYLLFDDNLRLNGWVNEQTGETKPVGLKKVELYNKLAFAGIQVLSPAVFGLMGEWDAKFPVMDFYLANAATQVINGFVPDDFKMMDVGKINVLDEAAKFVAALSAE